MTATISSFKRDVTEADLHIAALAVIRDLAAEARDMR